MKQMFGFLTYVIHW